MLGKKQSLASQAIWLDAKRRARELLPTLPARIEFTVERIRKVVGHRDLCFGWSGGKDSIVLERVLGLAGFRACVLVITNLEYSAFLQWVTLHMPERLTVMRTNHDLGWLQRNPEMLFPQDSEIAARWFHQVQHRGQEAFVKKEDFAMIAVGRRRKDGNYCGPEGVYTNRRGVTRFAPLFDWTHEEIFAALEYFKADLPPCYGWPRGYQVGTGPWAARQFAPSRQIAWSEVYQIEPQIVVDAARAAIPGAGEFMRTAR
jgi:3'-phosphoadenosine 5'-phosphosulfate sulfotransferase (PAPS reductase)/FAD synthetase